MSKVSIEELNDYVNKLKTIITKILDSKLNDRMYDKSQYQITEFLDFQYEVLQIDIELRTLFKDSHSKDPYRVTESYTIQTLCNMIQTMINEIDQYIEYYQAEEDENRKKQVLIYKMGYSGDPKELKSYLNQLLIHDIIKCDIDNAFCLQDIIVFTGENPEKDVTAFMSFLYDKTLINSDDNKTINSCFKNQSGIWNNIKLNKNRSKFKNAEIKNHIKAIIEKAIL